MKRSGEVFVQTYTPFSPSIQFARHHDFEGYFEQELEFRERCDFPPFKHAILITVRSAHEAAQSYRPKRCATSERIIGTRIYFWRRDPGAVGKIAGPIPFSYSAPGRSHYATKPISAGNPRQLPFPKTSSSPSTSILISCCNLLETHAPRVLAIAPRDRKLFMFCCSENKFSPVNAIKACLRKTARQVRSSPI